ncbi:MAG: hypothetical protein MZV64_43655 [Ignavibacteriales bacterium]|nr:hypothetical protein [Ignavibacteriales bacterium]
MWKRTFGPAELLLGQARSARCRRRGRRGSRPDARRCAGAPSERETSGEVVADPGRRPSTRLKVGDGLVERAGRTGPPSSDGLGMDGRPPGRRLELFEPDEAQVREAACWPSPAPPGRCSPGCPAGRGRRRTGASVQVGAHAARL